MPQHDEPVTKADLASACDELKTHITELRHDVHVFHQDIKQHFDVMIETLQAAFVGSSNDEE